jgi:hydroxymethylbilane synthase
VAALLRAAYPGLTIEIEVISTRGDRVLDVPLPSIGGKGVFTEELELALRERRIDLAVHSLKDLPVASGAGLAIGAIPARADARDALVSRRGERLSDLPAGAVVGTSSLRRIAQLRRHRPDLSIRDMRGNVDTRVRKLQQGEYDAILLACAGLDRLGLSSVISERLSLEQMMPAPGQAALGVQCRDDVQSLLLLGPLNDHRAEVSVRAERAFLAGLGGGCSVPVAAYAAILDGHLTLEGRVTSVDGSRQVDVSLTQAVATVEEADALGLAAAHEAARQGAKDLLAHSERT